MVKCFRKASLAAVLMSVMGVLPMPGEWQGAIHAADQAPPDVKSGEAQQGQKFDFEKDKAGSEPQSFAPMVGDWYVVDDHGNKCFAVDGRKWAKGKVASGVADKARALYGERYAEFLDPVQTYAYFPLAVCKDVNEFTSGDITVRFKAVSGRIDQAAGIAFNIRPNGDYLILRANALEHNIVLWKYQRGHRKKLKWISHVTTPTGHWHELALRVEGSNIKGYFNGRKVLEYVWQAPVKGKVGLWSKADSVAYFDDFVVVPEKG
ncbi:MAG TPA: hypothetical protein V6D17_17810 [Candidatus Obscuribacterales bacterium]